MNDTWWNVPEEHRDRLIDIVGSDTASAAELGSL